jgi:hypothetical protein
MLISCPFLATSQRQFLAAEACGDACEATVFDRSALDVSSWSNLWRAVEHVSRSRGPSNVTVHFPVNDSDYVADTFVADRLMEAATRVADMGLHGLIVHSNRIRSIEAWQAMSVTEERERVLEELARLNMHRSTPVPIFIENMPIMDNYGMEIDPIFVFPGDFKDVSTVGISIVWDICHYSNTVAVVREVAAGKQRPEYYPNIQDCDMLDFLGISDRIGHWHFSAFSGIANPSKPGTRCVEGVRPDSSTLGESVYAAMLRGLSSAMAENTHLVLEIQETDYTDRLNFAATRDWIQSVLAVSPKST